METKLKPTRLIAFLFVFTAMNLVFVPLLALYGLRVCPVLSIPGFGFGCYYAGLFILCCTIFNAAFITLYRRKRWLEAHSAWVFIGSYILATLAALALLQVMLHLSHLSSSSRAPQILGLASLLLALTQSYGLSWALPSGQVTVQSQPRSFKTLWRSHMIRTLLPFFAVGGILLHFLISQSVSFNEGRTAPLVSNDDLIKHTSYVVGALFGWLIVTFTFHFLAERDQVIAVQLHLSRLQQLDTTYRSPPNRAWGLWSAILNQLNSFSKVLGERTRLLKSFSRFVTADVAEQALDEDLTLKTGVTRELTVIMTDIRGFTAISEKLAPSQVVALLNEYFSTMIDVLYEFPISIDKFIGDGILAYVDRDESETLNPNLENTIAVEASIKMLARLENLNLKLPTLGLPNLKIGIGIYRGPVVIGLIGSSTKVQHTIIGDAVNRAARIESLCKDLDFPIVFPDGIWQSLPERLRPIFKACGPMPVKGLKEPMEVFGGPKSISANSTTVR